MKRYFARLYQKIQWVTRITRALGADAASRRRLFWGGLWLLINDTWKTEYRFSAHITRYGRTVEFHFEDIGDYGLLWEAFIDETYALDQIQAPEVIVDLGSNIGASVLYFRMRYPKASIYGFEPDPNNFRRLQRNTRALDKITLREVAAWSSNGTIDFYVDPHRGCSSSPFRVRARQHPERVEARSLDRLLDEAGLGRIDILKFDIEGAEREVLSAAECLDRVRLIVGEVHSDIGASQLNAIAALLPAHYQMQTRQLAEERHLLIASEAIDPQRA